MKISYRGLMFIVVCMCGLNSAFGSGKNTMDDGLFDEISDDVFAAVDEYSANIEKLNDLNENMTSKVVVFPQSLKSDMDDNLKTVLSAYDDAINRALKINKEKRKGEDINKCENGLQEFDSNIFVPLKAEVEKFSSMNVSGQGEKKIAMLKAANLGLGCSAITSQLVSDILHSCILMIDIPAMDNARVVE